MSTDSSIPVIDVSALFDAPSAVIGAGQQRMSIPFFYEARADAEIRPLPIDAGDSFEPFLYGDYLWATTTQFAEFKGMESLRKPLRR